MGLRAVIQGLAMRKVVLFPHPKSPFGVLYEMTEELQKAFHRQGMEAVLIDIANSTPESVLEAVRSENPDCTFSINLFVDEEWFGIPHVYLGVDGFTHHHSGLLSSPHTIPLFVDKETADLFTKKGASPAIWVPHAISKETLAGMRDKQTPWSKRPYDVVFVGSFIDHEQELVLWNSFLNPSDVQALQNLAEKALDDPSIPFFPEALSMIEESPSIRKAMRERDISQNDLVNSVENYMRGCDRERVVKAMKGRKVHFFTTADSAIALANSPSYKGCIFHSAVPFHEVLSICSQAKVVINSSPSIRKGYHERLLLGLAAGAIVVTSASVVLPLWLEESGAVVSYTTSTLLSVAERLSLAERHPRPVEKIIKWIEQYHTWDARLAEHLPAIGKRVQIAHETWK